MDMQSILDSPVPVVSLNIIQRTFRDENDVDMVEISLFGDEAWHHAVKLDPTEDECCLLVLHRKTSLRVNRR